jgi:uncharacterized protein
MRDAGLGELLATVLARSTHRQSLLHGEHHWQCVAALGAELSREVPGADRLSVFLFALFHDAMRENDDDDPEHGYRGALLARELLGDGRMLDSRRLDVLFAACSEHTDGLLAADPTIGVCWDADRLTLWRVGKRPDARFLSTEPARLPARIEAARTLQQRSFDWDRLLP